MVLARRESRLSRRESRLERRESRLERRDSRLARNETRGGNLLLSGTVLTMDPVAVSAKEYVGKRSIFVLTAFNSEYLASLAYIFTCFLPRWRTKRQCHVTCRSQLNRALEARNTIHPQLSLFFYGLILSLCSFLFNL